MEGQGVPEPDVPAGAEGQQEESGVPAWDPSQPLPSGSGGSGSDSESTDFEEPEDPHPSPVKKRRGPEEDDPDFLLADEVLLLDYVHKIAVTSMEKPIIDIFATVCSTRTFHGDLVVQHVKRSGTRLYLLLHNRPSLLHNLSGRGATTGGTRCRKAPSRLKRSITKGSRHPPQRPSRNTAQRAGSLYGSTCQSHMAIGGSCRIASRSCYGQSCREESFSLRNGWSKLRRQH